MNYVFNKLKGRIVEIVETNNAFMELMGWSKPTMYAKLSGESEFTHSEIVKACEILNIPMEDMHLYFFQVKRD